MSVRGEVEDSELHPDVTETGNFSFIFIIIFKKTLMLSSL